MKILLVNDYSERIGGTEVYIETLISHLEKNGHEVFTYFGSNDYKSSTMNRVKFNSYLNRIFSIKHYINFKKTLDKVQPDIIHLHNIFNEVTPSILLHINNIPVVMTLHDYHLIQAVNSISTMKEKKCRRQVCPGCLNCVGLKGLIYEKIKRSIHSVLLQRISLFIAPSKFLQNLVLTNSKYKPIQLYNGFDLDAPSPILNYTNALFSGRLTEDKGVNYLIEAIPAILKHIPTFKLVVIGEGNLKKYLVDRTLELNIQDSVKFLGHLNRNEVYEQYRLSTILILPSIWPENLPTVCIEALSVGRPVIASDIGGIPEIVKNNTNGYLLKPKNSELLANAIVKLLLDEKSLNQFHLNSYTSINYFSINEHIKGLTEIYESL